MLGDSVSNAALHLLGRAAGNNLNRPVQTAPENDDGFLEDIFEN
jgi:hypothetical protein